MIYEELLKECNVAVNLRDGLLLYLRYGILSGSFLTACLENNLYEALGHASTQHWDYVYNVVFFLYNHAPSDSWGSKEKVKQFINSFQEKVESV